VDIKLIPKLSAGVLSCGARQQKGALNIAIEMRVVTKIVTKYLKHIFDSFLLTVPKCSFQTDFFQLKFESHNLADQTN
jgi:hypothetical protein